MYTRARVARMHQPYMYTTKGRQNEQPGVRRPRESEPVGGVGEFLVVAKRISARCVPAYLLACLPACLPVANRQPCLVARRLCLRRAINWEPTGERFLGNCLPFPRRRAPSRTCPAVLIKRGKRMVMDDGGLPFRRSCTTSLSSTYLHKHEL